MARIDYDDDDADDTTEKYHESDDEDFNPDSAPPEEVSSESDDEDIASIPKQRKGKRKAPVEEELDSGDEVTIQNARKKRSKKGKKGKKDANDEDDDLIISDDDGGEGGLIKTRAQRKVEKVQRKPLARTEGATVDVDALWAQMIAPPAQPAQPVEPEELDPATQPITTDIPAPVATEEEEQISIKKTYTFAGQDTTEEKSVPQSHLDKYLSDGWKTTSDDPSKPGTDKVSKHKANTSQTRRPLRRPSRFDPNPTGYVRALAPEFQLTWPRTHATSTAASQGTALMPPPDLPAKARPEKAQKLNVVDKSRMDWTGFVDKEGIGEELKTHGKTKEAYLGRMEFLAGVEARREEERKRVKGVVAGKT